jgi:acetyltransferase-like isoleucine patch superfamily enzyme
LPLKIEGDTVGNHVTIDEVFSEASNGIIYLRGSDIVVTIKSNRPSHNLLLDLDTRSRVTIGENTLLPTLHIHSRGGSVIMIGSETSATGVVNLYSHETCQISIGDGCLLGPSFQCFASDMHAILDRSTNRRINPPEGIVIEDKVWAGADVTILKGTRVGSGSIIGLRSTVAGTFPPHCLIAGYPARIVKAGVEWAADLVPHF